ncbi:MAG: LemA family protein [Flavobacteriales bacterium]
MKIVGREIKASWIIGGVLAIIILWGFMWNNGTVDADEDVKAQWGQVQSTYQMRNDLIPSLINVVKGYAKHEKEVLTQVTQARASVGNVKIDPSKLSQEQIQNFEQSQNSIGSAVSRLLVVAEQYPDLQASKNFQQLHDEWTGTERRINTERIRFNEVAAIYNKRINKIPGSLFNMISGFEGRPYFEAQKGAEIAPKSESLLQ